MCLKFNMRTIVLYLTVLALHIRQCFPSNASYSESKSDFTIPFVISVPPGGHHFYGDNVLDGIKLQQSVKKDLKQAHGIHGASVSRNGDIDGISNQDDDRPMQVHPAVEFESSPMESHKKDEDVNKKEIITTALTKIRDKTVNSIESGSMEVGRQFSSMNFPSLEAALLSLAFLTFAVFVIDLVQDLLRGTSTGRRRRSEDDPDEGMKDVIVLALSSLDTFSYGSQNPNCGQKLLCHLNRAGWHDGVLGTASNYIVSLFLSIYSPKSGFQKNLEAAQFGRKSDGCTDRYPACPSVLGEMLPT